jgi:hypothetical protein
MKYKELTSEILDEVIKELKDRKKSEYFRHLVDLQGHIGCIYQALEEMFYHGRFVYPTTYKYRRELAKYYKDYVARESKKWVGKQL